MRDVVSIYKAVFYVIRRIEYQNNSRINESFEKRIKECRMI